MQGPDPDDPVCAGRAVEPDRAALAGGSTGCASRVAGGYFRPGACRKRSARSARGRGARRDARDRRAARGGARRAPRPIVITAIEGAQLHLDRLRARAAGFRSRHARPLPGRRPAARRRGTCKAQRFRRRYREAVLELFDEVDIILAPATPCTAPPLGQKMMTARRRRAAGARQSRHVHPADLASSACRSWRCPIGIRRRARSACRSSPGPSTSRWPCAWRIGSSSRASPRG